MRAIDAWCISSTVTALAVVQVPVLPAQHDLGAYFTHRDRRNRRMVITETGDGDRVRDGDGDRSDLFVGGLLGAAAGGSL
jgi:hypothetical protein